MSFSTANYSSAPTDFSIKTEQQLEKLVADISGVIRAAEPERRAGLKELAETLLHEEISTIAEETRPLESKPRRVSFNPLASGILLIILGLGFLLIVPPVGMTLAFIGLVLAVWGGVMSWLKN